MSEPTTDRPKEQPPSTGMPLSPLQSCGCMVLVALVLVLVYLGKPLSTILTAIAEWIGRQ